MSTNEVKSSKKPERDMTFALVGNPNCGKTTLFNALTGLKQKVGNYPGVTVERKEGECFLPHGEKVRIIDLPGAYSLNARSPDEAVLRDVLLGRRKDTPRPDRIIIVLDASNLERHLYLSTQILELGIPCILALNMMDIVAEQGVEIDVDNLSKSFGGIPVIPMQASHRKGLVEIKHCMSKPEIPAPKFKVAIPEEINDGLEKSWKRLRESGLLANESSLLEPLYLLSDRDPTHYGIQDKQLDAIQDTRKELAEKFPGWEDKLVAARYVAIYVVTQ